MFACVRANMLVGKASDTGEGAILPTWTAVDIANVRTMRELMEGMRRDGWNVDVRSYTSIYLHICLIVAFIVSPVCSKGYER